MKQKIFLMLLSVSILICSRASAQMDSAAAAKKQKEIEKSEKTINSMQAKVDKKDRKMNKALKRAERKQRKKDKKLDHLRKEEKKREQLIRDTSRVSINAMQTNDIATVDNKSVGNLPLVVLFREPADRLYVYTRSA